MAAALGGGSAIDASCWLPQEHAIVYHCRLSAQRNHVRCSGGCRVGTLNRTCRRAGCPRSPRCWPGWCRTAPRDLLPLLPHAVLLGFRKPPWLPLPLPISLQHCVLSQAALRHNSQGGMPMICCRSLCMFLPARVHILKCHGRNSNMQSGDVAASDRPRMLRWPCRAGGRFRTVPCCPDVSHRRGPR